MRLFCRHNFEHICTFNLWEDEPLRITNINHNGIIEFSKNNIPYDVIEAFMCKKCGKVIRISANKGVLR